MRGSVNAIRRESKQFRNCLAKVEERAKSNTKSLDEFDSVMKENNSLVTAIKELAVGTKYMRSDLNETIQRLSKLEGRDAEKWEKFKWILVTGTIKLSWAL